MTTSIYKWLLPYAYDTLHIQTRTHMNMHTAYMSNVSQSCAFDPMCACAHWRLCVLYQATPTKHVFNIERVYLHCSYSGEFCHSSSRIDSFDWCPVAIVVAISYHYCYGNAHRTLEYRGRRRVLHMCALDWRGVADSYYSYYVGCMFMWARIYKCSVLHAYGGSHLYVEVVIFECNVLCVYECSHLYMYMW